MEIFKRYNINPNTLFYNTKNGNIYRILEEHFNDYYAEVSEEWDEEKGEYINFEKCYLTEREVKNLIADYIRYN